MILTSNHCPSVWNESLELNLEHNSFLSEAFVETTAFQSIASSVTTPSGLGLPMVSATCLLVRVALLTLAGDVTLPRLPAARPRSRPRSRSGRRLQGGSMLWPPPLPPTHGY